MKSALGPLRSFACGRFAPLASTRRAWEAPSIAGLVATHDLAHFVT